MRPSQNVGRLHQQEIDYLVKTFDHYSDKMGLHARTIKYIPAQIKQDMEQMQRIYSYHTLAVMIHISYRLPSETENHLFVHSTVRGTGTERDAFSSMVDHYLQELQKIQMDPLTEGPVPVEYGNIDDCLKPYPK